MQSGAQQFQCRNTPSGAPREGCPIWVQVEVVGVSPTCPNCHGQIAMPMGPAPTSVPVDVPTPTPVVSTPVATAPVVPPTVPPATVTNIPAPTPLPPSTPLPAPAPTADFELPQDGSGSTEIPEGAPEQDEPTA